MSLAELGAQIRAERESRGFSIEMVASHLKISQRVLRALEEGDESSLPQGVYLRGFLRSYASMLDIDNAIITSHLNSIAAPEEVQLAPIQLVPRRSSSKGLGTFFIVLLVFACLLGGGYWYYRTVLTVDLAAEAPAEEALAHPAVLVEEKTGIVAETPPVQTTPSVEKNVLTLDPAKRLSVQSPYEKNLSSSSEGSTDLNLSTLPPQKTGGADLDVNVLNRLPVSEDSRISGENATALPNPAPSGSVAPTSRTEKTPTLAVSAAPVQTGAPAPVVQVAPVVQAAPVVSSAQTVPPAQTVQTAQSAQAVVANPSASVESASGAVFKTDGSNKIIVTAVEECWIRSEADGADRREFALHKGETFALAFNKKLVLLLGNAGGVKLRFNGEDLPEPGKRGQVKTLTFPPE